MIDIRVTDIPQVLSSFYGTGRTPYFLGQPGCGKTDLVHESAKVISDSLAASGDKHPNVDVYELHLASMSEVDVRGYLIPNGGNAVFTRPVFANAVDKSQRGILFIDEFSQSNAEIQKAIAPLILAGRIGDYKLPAGWMVVLAGNRESDNSGVEALLSHIINRVCIINVKPPEVDDWISWAAKNNLDHNIITFAKLSPTTIMGEPDLTTNNEPYCTPRSMHSLSTVSTKWSGGLSAMMSSAVGLSVIGGFIGKGAAAELKGVLELSSKLPSFEDIIANPMNTHLPSKPDEVYAVIIMTAMRASIKQGSAAVKYITRFDPNMCYVGLSALVNRDLAFTKEPLISEWLKKNKDMVKRMSKYMR